ncbi:MAG: helix-turn-helix transcriptional regulator [Clostridia bacterium]|nr:helix-turn-helix transcriptional regulator [Clostridia bacterium]
MSNTFRDHLNELLKDPEFKAEWDAMEPEYQITLAIIQGRNRLNLSQAQLAELTGIHQADISRLENGSGNPSLKTLKRLAAGLNMKLVVSFEPI